MDYREHRVPPPLDAFVECVWFLADTPGDRGAAARSRLGRQRILPDGCAELIFHFRGPVPRDLRDRPVAAAAGVLRRRPADVAVRHCAGGTRRHDGAYASGRAARTRSSRVRCPP